MPIQFLLREKATEILYWKALLNLIAMEGNVLILSTGYIHNSSVWANGAAVDSLVIAIDKRNKEYSSILTVKIVGGDTDKTYPENFKDFCKELYSKVSKPKQIHIKFERVITDNWHGKVAIKLEEDAVKPSSNIYYGAVVGSSNLTPINIISAQFGWNMETDLSIVDGKEVKNSELHRVKEEKMNIRVCEGEIRSDIKKINSGIKNIKSINIAIADPINIKAFVVEDLKELKDQCKYYLKIITDKKDENIKDDKNDDKINGKFYFTSILQSIASINNVDRIKKEINESFKSLEKSVNDLKAKTIILIFLVDQIIFERYEDIENKALKLLKEKETSNADNFEELHIQIKDFQKEFYKFRKDDEEPAIVECFNAIDLFNDNVKNIRKKLLVFNTVHDLKTDGTYIEPMLKGIYNGINSVIDNLTTEEISL